MNNYERALIVKRTLLQNPLSEGKYPKLLNSWQNLQDRNCTEHSTSKILLNHSCCTRDVSCVELMSLVLLCVHVAVSYTHLDVYKRQPFGPSTHPFFMVFKAPNPSVRNCIFLRQQYIREINPTVIFWKEFWTSNSWWYFFHSLKEIRLMGADSVHF